MTGILRAMGTLSPRHLAVQIQAQHAADLDVEYAVSRLMGLTQDVERTDGDEDGTRYITLLFKPSSLVALWREMQGSLRDTPGLSHSAIVTCQGANGWDDYLLLHHFDPKQDLDSL